MRRKTRRQDQAVLQPKGSSKIADICELCGREGVQTTEHHLTPKEEGGSMMPTAMLCIPCHKQIHALFTNARLARDLHTIEALRSNEEMKGFLKWIRRQPSTTIPRTRKSKVRL